ncbi:Uncharacterised protein [Starkeya nomas]|uniref:Glycerophosphoryl diester phosphodiesterase membrane domain-containing protein n=1 Tax=Starkeya nomas TaxID=2666134 RepID=A0A5S9PQE3_9HYPH|nr:hypothetical protein [Starkeya nomas]CAA0106400.1 Uncharacterised protein [Starkeya nomas]
MWDFSIATTLGLVLRTWPFVLLRLAVYSLIAAGFVFGTVLGLVIGWIVGNALSGESGLVGATIGGLCGLGLVFGVLWWVRQYLVYLIKAGHVAAMDALLRGGKLPSGLPQIAHAVATVKARFLEVNVLFGIDILIRGGVHALVGLLDILTFWIPGFRAVNNLINAVLTIALGLVDEIVLAYIIRREDEPPADAARDGLVLYAQNAGPLIRNAVWIVLFRLVALALIFLLVLGPAIALAYALPDGLAGAGVIFAAIFAWGLAAALIEPLAIAALLQAYDRAIRGQTPDPEWTAKLDEASSAFRDLARHAPVPGAAPQPT